MSDEQFSFPFDLNGYEFLGCIGRGTYSTCFKVFSRQYQQFFAAKMTEILDDDFFDENGTPRDPELDALLKLDHPNVIKVYKSFRYDIFFFLILELCTEGTLADRLQGRVPISMNQIYSYMLDILDALVYCHKQNIAHRDIKPQNIFIDSHDRAKVADFGLSSVLKARHDLVDTACGSPNYAAPEIYGNQAYDPFKADVFALGVTYYQMLVRKLPWPEEITTAGPERPPPTFPRMMGTGMINLIQSMLDLDYNKRPSMEMISNSDVIVEIRQRLSGQKKGSDIKPALSFRTQSKELMHTPLINNVHIPQMKLQQHMVFNTALANRVGKKRRNSARIMSRNSTFQDNI